MLFHFRLNTLGTLWAAAGTSRRTIRPSWNATGPSWNATGPSWSNVRPSWATAGVLYDFYLNSETSQGPPGGPPAPPGGPPPPPGGPPPPPGGQILLILS